MARPIGGSLTRSVGLFMSVCNKNPDPRYHVQLDLGDFAIASEKKKAGWNTRGCKMQRRCVVHASSVSRHERFACALQSARKHERYACAYTCKLTDANALCSSHIKRRDPPSSNEQMTEAQVGGMGGVMTSFHMSGTCISPTSMQQALSIVLNACQRA